MLEAQSLTRRYGDFVAVDNVSFRIDPGEVVGLLGHNGAGKTTIMKMLTGFLEPSAGDVLIDGRNIADHAQWAQARIGYLPENLPLYPELSVADYLRYVSELRGLEAATSIPPAVRATQLEEKLYEPISTLSRGYKQRVGVAQAILHAPDFLILDEPTNGLDPSQTQQMRALIKDLSQQATVILSTHIMQEVEAVCDRALILRGGQMAVDERLAELVETATLHVRAQGDAVETTLRAVPGVLAMANVDANDAWQVQADGDVDECAASIAHALVQAGVRLLEIKPVRQDLEGVFRRVNEEVA